MEIVFYDDRFVEAVKRFNMRLKKGGSLYQFPESHIPYWLPKTGDRKIYQEFLTDGPCGHLSHELLHTGYTSRGKYIT